MACQARGLGEVARANSLLREARCVTLRRLARRRREREQEQEGEAEERLEREQEQELAQHGQEQWQQDGQEQWQQDGQPREDTKELERGRGALDAQDEAGAGACEPGSECAKAVAFLGQMLGLRLGQDAAACEAAVLESAGDRSLRRALHDAADSGVRSWLQDLVNVKQHLVTAMIKDSRLLYLVQGVVADGLLSRDPEAHRLSCELTETFFRGLLEHDHEKQALVLQEWLCDPDVLGLEPLLAAAHGDAASEPATEVGAGAAATGASARAADADATATGAGAGAGAGASISTGREAAAAAKQSAASAASAAVLGDLVLRVFQGRLYDLFARALPRVGLAEDVEQAIAEEPPEAYHDAVALAELRRRRRELRQQSSCVYFALCRRLLDQPARPLRAEMIECNVVAHVLGLAVRALERALATLSAADEGDAGGAARAAAAAAALGDAGGVSLCSGEDIACVQSAVRLALLVSEQYPAQFAAQVADARLGVLVRLRCPALLQSARPGVRAAADAVVALLLRAGATTLCERDPSGRAFADASLQLFAFARDTPALFSSVCTAFLDALPRARVSLPPHGAAQTCDLAARGLTAIFPGAPEPLLEPLTRVLLRLLEVAGEGALAQLVDTISLQVLNRPAPRPGAVVVGAGAGAKASAPTSDPVATAASRLLLAVLTASDGTIAGLPAVRARRRRVAEQAVAELETLHSVYKDGAGLAAQRRATAQIADRLACRDLADLDKEVGLYATAPRQARPASSPRASPASPSASATACAAGCSHSGPDRALRAVLLALAVFEVELASAARPPTAQSQASSSAGSDSCSSLRPEPDLVRRLSASRCQSVQELADKARAFMHSAASREPLAALSSSSSTSPRALSAGGTPVSLSVDAASALLSPTSKRLWLGFGARRSPSGARLKPLEVDLVRKRQVADLEAAVKERCAREQAAAQERRESEEVRERALRLRFEEQRARLREKRFLDSMDRMLSSELQKEYLDLKDTAVDREERVERGFESRVAEEQTAWAGVQHVTKDIAEHVFRTTKPYCHSLRRVFSMFAAMGVEPGASFQAIRESGEVMSSREWIATLKAFEIVPQGLSTAQAMEIFHRHAKRSALSYFGFLLSLWDVARYPEALRALWATSGFASLTATRDPARLAPGWFASRRKASARRAGCCPATRFHVVAEHMRCSAERTPELGKWLGTWTARQDGPFTGGDAYWSLSPALEAALEVLDDVLRIALGPDRERDGRPCRLLLFRGCGQDYALDRDEDDLDEEGNYALAVALDDPAAAQRGADADRRWRELAEVEASRAKAPPHPLPRPSEPPATEFALWLAEQKRSILPKWPRPHKEVLELEQCARVLWRVIGQVESRSRPQHVTAALERGAMVHVERQQQALKEQRERSEREKARLELQKKLYEKERGDRVEAARKEREARLAEAAAKEAADKEEAERREKARLERLEQSKVALKESLERRNTNAAAMLAAANAVRRASVAFKAGAGNEIKPRALGVSVLSSRTATAGTSKSSTSVRSARSGASRSARSPKLGALDEDKPADVAQRPVQSPPTEPEPKPPAPEPPADEPPAAAGERAAVPAPAAAQSAVPGDENVVVLEAPAAAATVAVNASFPALVPTPSKATLVGASHLPDLGPARGLSALQLGAALAAPPQQAANVIGVHVETLQSVAKSVREPHKSVREPQTIDAQSLNGPAPHNQPFRPKGLGALERIAKDKGQTPTSAKTPKAQHGGEQGASTTAPGPGPAAYSMNQEMLTPDSPVIEATVLPSLAATAEQIESPNLEAHAPEAHGEPTQAPDQERAAAYELTAQ